MLDKVLGSLEKLTGRTVTPNDLLERQPDPEPMDDETRSWEEARLAPELEPYDWGDTGPETAGEAPSTA